MSEKEILHALLTEHGGPPEGRFVDEGENIVLEKDGVIIGFATVTFPHPRMPHLNHFLVARKSRTPQNARKLIRGVMKFLKQRGLRNLVVHVPDEHPRLFKFIKYFFKKPLHYFSEQKHKFYLVEVV